MLREIGYGNIVDFLMCRNFFFLYSDQGGQLSLNWEILPLISSLKIIDAISSKSYTFTSLKTMNEYVYAHIVQGEPVLINVDTYDIPEYRDYQKWHNRHSTIVIGISPRGYELSDMNFSGHIPFCVLSDSQKLASYSVTEFEHPRGNINYSKKNVAAVLKTIHEMGTINQPILIAGNIENASGERIPIPGYSGAEGIMRFSQHIQTTIEIDDLKLIQEHLRKAGDLVYNFVVQRFWFLGFLSAYEAIFGVSAVSNDLFEKVKSVSQEWKITRNMFHKASVKDTVEMAHRTADRLCNIAESEINIYKLLQELTDM